MEGNIAVTYALIYRFLKQKSQNKAAEAIKKAAKAFVVLRDDVEQQGPSLEDIIQEWRTKQNIKPEDTDSASSKDSGCSDDTPSDSENAGSDSDSSSEDSSGSESEDDDTSDSDDSGDDSKKGTKADNLPPKVVERDTSVTLSSAGENAREVARKVVQMPEKGSNRTSKNENSASESDSSDSDKPDSDSSSDGSTSDNSDAETSSSSSDSSDEDEASVRDLPSGTKATDDKSSSTSESSSDSDNSDSESQQKEDAPVAKKRKTLENGTAVTTAVATGSQQTARAPQRIEKPPPKIRERFQRVKTHNLAPDLLLDNGYTARGAAVNDYGERAHRDLIVTRGAGFRKEKNKKKRGSYRGGEITMENHSIKFDF